jgi:hypothetical protein
LPGVATSSAGGRRLHRSCLHRLSSALRPAPERDRGAADFVNQRVQRPTSAGPRHWPVRGSRTRPLPHPPRIGSCVCETKGAGGAEGRGATDSETGGFRIGAPAANAQNGTASIVIVVPPAKTNRRLMEASLAVSHKNVVVTTGSFNATMTAQRSSERQVADRVHQPQQEVCR